MINLIPLQKIYHVTKSTRGLYIGKKNAAQPSTKECTLKPESAA